MAVARACDVVSTIVGFPDDVREVYVGEHGIIGATRDGMILVGMTTASPTFAVEIARVSAQKCLMVRLSSG